MSKTKIKNYLQPFSAFIPNTAMASKTIAPLYDTVTSEQAKMIADNNPVSFLHVSKAEIDFDQVLPYNNPRVYQKANENLTQLLETGIFIKLDAPAYYVYEINTINRTQIGLVALCDVEAVTDGLIKAHEQTRESKALDRMKNIMAVQSSVSSVMLAHKQNADISDLLLHLTKRLPDISAEDSFKIKHNLYIINDPVEVALINQHYNHLENYYIADGHHRTQAAVSAAAALKDNQNAAHFIVTIFPEEQLQILGYHRIVPDLNGHLPEELLHALCEFFNITPTVDAVLPNKQHTFGLYLNNRWYKLDLNSEYLDKYLDNQMSVFEQLDCTILHNLVLEPLFGITDERTSRNIEFFGGSHSYKNLEQIVDGYTNGVAFTLAPVKIQDLFAVSDLDLLMPPKSTWFYPKICDGLFFYKFDL